MYLCMSVHNKHIGLSIHRRICPTTFVIFTNEVPKSKHVKRQAP